MGIKYLIGGLQHHVKVPEGYMLMPSVTRVTLYYTGSKQGNSCPSSYDILLKLGFLVRMF